MANGLTAANTAPTGIWKKLQQLIAGIQKDIPAGSTMVVNGQKYTQAQLVTLLQGLLALFLDAMTAKLAYMSKLKAREDELVTARDTYAAVKAVIVAQLGRKNPQLGDFGLSPHAPKVLTTEQKQLQAAKAKVTREKRHTMGKTQKAGLKATGTPTVQVGPNGVEVTPAAVDQAPEPASGTSGSGSAASATPAPAPAGSGSTGAGK